MNSSISSSKKMCSYLKLFLLSFASLIILVASTNVLVDPFGNYNIIEIDGFNAKKYGGDSRMAKAISIAEKRYDALILGSSRSEIGLDPFHRCWRNLSVYNLSLSATNMYETYHVFNYAMTVQQPKTILLSLDFLMFTDRRSINRDFNLSRFNQSGFIVSSIREILGIFTLKESISTVKNNFAGTPGLYKSGFRDGEIVFSNAVNEIGHRQLFWNAIERNFLINSQTYRGYRYNSDRINMIRAMIKTCLEKHINVIVIIPPVHALQMETIYSINLWPVFENWKRDLVNMISSIHAEKNIPVYDFTSWDGRVAEKLPKKTREKMKWFWESSHFKKELGDLVLSRSLDCSTLSQYGKGFGVLLTQKSIDDQLQQLRGGRMKYITGHQQEINTLASLFKRNGLSYE